MRVSVSQIAGLFYGASTTAKMTRPKAASIPNDFTVKNIFPHGNVHEHRALEIIKHTYPDAHGQSAFARLIDRSSEFVPQLKLDTQYATNARQAQSASFPEFRMLQHWKAETDKLRSYVIHGVTYDIGRREKQIGNITLVCQPDGLCQNDRTTIEIKCPFGDMYTLDNTEKWLKHIVQAALEMLVFNTDQSLLVVYYAPRAIYSRYQDRPVVAKQMLLNREALGPLMSQLATFIHRLGMHGKGDDAREIYMSCESEMTPLFLKVQDALQKVPLNFQHLVIPEKSFANEANLAVVFIGDRSATLSVGMPYRLVAEPDNRYDSTAIRVVPAHRLLDMPAPCYVTRAAKGAWLFPLLNRVIYCRAVDEKLLHIKMNMESGTHTKKKRKKTTTLLF